MLTVRDRLGALGFLATASKLPGNAAITDQIAALKFVRDRISAFGGDPARVTIMGQSAGAQSVLALMSSSGAKGLFRAAIAQSPPVSMPWFTRKLYSERITHAIAAQVGCTSTDEAQLVDCLLKVDATALVEAVPAATPAIATALADFANAPGAPQPFLPMVDGPAGTIDGQLSALLASGSLPNKVPLLVGNVRDEGELCVGGRPESADAAASSSPLCPRSARTRAFSARSCRCVCCASTR